MTHIGRILNLRKMPRPSAGAPLPCCTARTRASRSSLACAMASGVPVRSDDLGDKLEDLCPSSVLAWNQRGQRVNCLLGIQLQDSRLLADDPLQFLVRKMAPL